MPQRQYFYTPIATENYHIGATDVNGVYIASSAMTPGATDPGAPLDVIPVYGDELMCLRADITRDRCVVSLPQEIDQVLLSGSFIDLGSLNEWQQVSRGQIESEYSNPDQNADDAQINFNVEEE